ncbi:MAG: DedA family protein [Frankiaceae bacterium]|nr:DedA family protein [Frankiaceae bacterium]MBV9869660.1 DedA family protein [Frankiaceae bacterium]
MTSDDLPGIFGSIAPLIDHHGYLAIGAAILLGNIGIPVVPMEAAMVVGAVFAANGHLDLTAVAMVATAAAAVGSMIGYLIGDRAGHPLIVAKGARIGITHERLASAEDFYRRRGVIIVLVSRFLPFLRRWSGLVAGVSEMPFGRFAVANLLGALVWAIAWAAIGDQAGGHLDTLSRFLSGRGVLVVGGAVVVLVVAVAVVRRRGSET